MRKIKVNYQSSADCREKVHCMPLEGNQHRIQKEEACGISCQAAFSKNCLSRRWTTLNANVYSRTSRIVCLEPASRCKFVSTLSIYHVCSRQDHSWRLCLAFTDCSLFIGLQERKENHQNIESTPALLYRKRRIRASPLTANWIPRTGQLREKHVFRRRGRVSSSEDFMYHSKLWVFAPYNHVRPHRCWQRSNIYRTKITREM